MNLRFEYELTNCEHIPASIIKQVQYALRIRAYVCQQDFERTLDECHEINIVDDEFSNGEAVVRQFAIEDGVCYVELDCSTIDYD